MSAADYACFIYLRINSVRLMYSATAMLSQYYLLSKSIAGELLSMFCPCETTPGEQLHTGSNFTILIH